MGGARPKALVNIGGEQWVIKFADGDPADTPLIEHASMTLAQKAAIRVAQTQPVRLIHGHAVVKKLFDHDRAYVFQNSDRRIVFAIPYERDFTLIGTNRGLTWAARCLVAVG